eukprot:13297667-Alexandrium_andersonii.AAC.1
MVPLAEHQAETPAHEVEGPEGPKPAASLCAARVALRGEYAKPEAWKQMVERPMAMAMQHLPKEGVAVAEP